MVVQSRTAGTADIPTVPMPERQGLFRAVSDLVRQEVSRLRGHAIMDKLDPNTRLDTDNDGAGTLGLKSLDLMDVASAVSDMFGIGNAGLDDLLLARRTLGAWAELAERALRSGPAIGDATIMFQTSGTTGKAKAVTHPFWRLAEEAGFWATAFADRKRIIAAVPGHHIYGFLFTCLLPGRLGVEVIDCRYSMPGSLIKSLKDGDLVIGQPDFWARVSSAAEKQGLKLPAGVSGVSSTAPLDNAVADILQTLGIERLVEAYGSTETLGLGWRVFPATHFALLPTWNRRSEIVHWKEGFTAPVQDRLKWIGPQHFDVDGRLDGMMQLAGTNINLARLVAAAEAVAGIARCKITMAGTENGKRLVAELWTDTESISPELKMTVREALDRLMPTGSSPMLRFIPRPEQE